MDFKVIEEKNRIILEDIKNFEPEHIFECGQAFRWRKEVDSSYTNVAYNRVINVKKEGNCVIINNSNLEDFQNIWYNYFDLQTDYSSIKEKLSEDDVLKEAVKFGSGIRILNQEPFETIITFIISANNQIPRIKKSVEIISNEYGEYIEKYGGEKYYDFPKADVLSEVAVEDLRQKSRVGFRDKRIIDSSRMIANGEIDIDGIYNMGKGEGQLELMKLPGVGPKVSDCVLLFAFGKRDAFPVDVWVKRIMEHFYTKEETKINRIGKLGDELFGELAGYAQQYLFYYAREQEIGK